MKWRACNGEELQRHDIVTVDKRAGLSPGEYIVTSLGEDTIGPYVTLADPTTRKDVTDMIGSPVKIAPQLVQFEDRAFDRAMREGI